MPVRSLLFLGLLLLNGTGMAQSALEGDSARHVHRGRLIGTCVGGGAAIAGSLIALNSAWYSQYPRSGFHFFDDGDEWLQLDKVGHGFSTYTVGRWGHGLLRWNGLPERTSVWVGGGLGTAYLTVVEVFDGYSAEWGFSGWDMVANVAGSGLFIGQQLGWKEQRIKVKYSAHLTDYATLRPDLLGEGTSERILKDYNGATYWISAAPNAFGWKRLPPWVGLAVGYGGEGMVTADRAPGQLRQYYLALDIDLERIPTKSRFLRTVFFALNCVKIPLPALELRGDGSFHGHALYF